MNFLKCLKSKKLLRELKNLSETYFVKDLKLHIFV
jgi:hypothetical protein